MSTIFGGDVHAGLANLNLEDEFYDLGEGIILRQVYAHLFASFMLAFNKPTGSGPHPGPWKAARGGLGFDFSAELIVPHNIEERFGSKIDVVNTILFLIRLGVNPATTCPAFANYSFTTLRDISNSEAMVFTYEIQPRHFPLGVAGEYLTAPAAVWIKERWQITHELLKKSPEFSLAVEALDSGQFIHKSALTLVSLWGALEALFSPSTSELKFRVSSLIAAYLEPAGTARMSRQKEIAKLYDKRSAAAHGKPNHESEHLLHTFNILREVLTKIIDEGHVPTKDELERNLFFSH